MMTLAEQAAALVADWPPIPDDVCDHVAALMDVPAVAA